MSWGLRYRSKWKDIDGNVKEARFYRRDYSGATYDWPLTQKSGVRYSWDKGDAVFPDNPIISCVAELGFYFDEIVDLSEMIDLEFKVVVENITTETIEFTGLLEPWDSTRPYSKPKHLVTFTATCGLSRLHKKRYSYPEGDTIRSELQIIWDCLKTIDTGLSLVTCVHIDVVTAPANADPLLSKAMSIYRYRDNEAWLKMDLVVRDILYKYNAELVLHNNTWYLISRPDQIIGAYTGYHTYENGETSGVFTPALPVFLKSFNYSDGFSLATGSVNFLHALRKYTAKLDAGEQREFFPNGDLQQFIEGTFPEWDLSKMANSSSNGWYKEDSFDEDYPNQIKLSGTRPTWLRKKKRWAGLVTKYWEEEPIEYIQSPIGEFSPLIESIQISFEYSCGKIKNFGIAIGIYDDEHPDEILWILEPDESKASDEWNGIVITPSRDSQIGDDVTPRYRITIPINIGGTNRYNTLRDGVEAVQYNRVFVRFYKVVDEEVSPSQAWYRIHWLKGREGSEIESNSKSDNAATGQYEVSFQVGDKNNDEEGQTIDLITGEYIYGFNGTILRPDGTWFTAGFRRPGFIEEVSQYFAFIMQRLWMTWRHLSKIEASFKLASGVDRLQYLDLIHLEDQNKTFQILSLDWDDHTRTAALRLVECFYSEPPEDIEQEALNRFPNGRVAKIKGTDGNVDRVYPPIGGSGTSGARKAFEDTEPDVKDLLEEAGVLPTPFDRLPTLYFIAGRNSDLTVNLADYFSEEYLDEENEHDPNDFVLSLVSAPVWSNYSGEGLEISLSGKPEQAGNTTLEVNLTDLDSGLALLLRIPVVIYPAPSLTYTLSPGGKLIPGQPVTLPHTPPYTLTVQAKGGHDAYRYVHRFGGTVQYDSNIIPVTYTENATYTPISSESLSQGIHVVFFQLLRQTGVDENDDPIYTAISGDDVIFKLGTSAEDPDRTVKLELASGGSKLGEIPGTYEYVEEWDIVPTPRGIKYDELFISILPEEEPYTTTLMPELTSVVPGADAEILDGSTGVTTPDAGYTTTSAIAVTPGQEYWLAEAPYSAAGYNSGAFATELAGEVLIIPTGVNQIRICWAGESLYSIDLAELSGTLFGGDTPKGAGNFTVFVRAFLAGSQVYERMENFTILEKEPEEPVEQEGIILIEPGNPVTRLADPLSLEGAVLPLPASFALLFNGFGTTEYDEITWKLFHGMTGMSEVSLSLYTGQSSEKSYSSPVTAASQLLFWGKSSLDIGTIHQAPNRLFAEVTGFLAGVKVAIAKADWIFSNTPIGPGSGMAYGYYDPAANVLSMQVANVPTTGGIYKLLVLEGQFWVVGSPTWNSSTQYNKRETEVNGIIVKTWTGGLTATNTDQADFLDWNRAISGLDDPGEKTIIERFYNGASLIGTKQAVITLYSADPDIKDPNDCCTGGGGDGGVIEVEFSPASTLWVHNHGLGYEASGAPIIDNEEWATKITFSPDKNTTYYHWNSPRAGKIVLTL